MGLLSKEMYRMKMLTIRRNLQPHSLPRLTILAVAASVIVVFQLIDTASLSAESNDRPNVLLIYTDDQGYGTPVV